MGLPPPHQPIRPSSIRLPPELRMMIYGHVLNLGENERRRRIRIVVDREVVPNTTTGRSHLRLVNAIFRYSSPDVFRTPGDPRTLCLVNRQTNDDVQTLMRVNKKYIEQLQTISGTSSARPRQEIVFHPERDTIVLDIPAMVDLHLNWRDTYRQSRIPLIPPLVGLTYVQNLVLPVTTNNLGERVNMPVLKYFIRPDQIPTIPREPGSGWADVPSAEEDTAESGEDEETAAPLRPYFLHATVTFARPARDRTLTNILFMLMRAQMMRCIPVGQPALGDVTSLENPANEHTRILSIIDAIDNLIQTEFESP